MLDQEVYYWSLLQIFTFLSGWLWRFFYTHSSILQQPDEMGPISSSLAFKEKNSFMFSYHHHPRCEFRVAFFLTKHLKVFSIILLCEFCSCMHTTCCVWAEEEGSKQRSWLFHKIPNYSPGVSMLLPLQPPPPLLGMQTKWIVRTTINNYLIWVFLRPEEAFALLGHIFWWQNVFTGRHSNQNSFLPCFWNWH